MADNEIWKSIPRYKGYEASNLGRVRSIDRWVTYKNGQVRFYKGKIINNWPGPRGYMVTNLGTRNYTKYIHHLVAYAFLGKPPKKRTPRGIQICHNNGNKSDNRPSNLRYDTPAANAFDVVKHQYEQAWLSYAKNPERKT